VQQNFELLASCSWNEFFFKRKHLSKVNFDATVSDRVKLRPKFRNVLNHVIVQQQHIEEID
jgi:hypothetical protein